jgi:hypothetical protein
MWGGVGEGGGRRERMVVHTHKVKGSAREAVWGLRGVGGGGGASDRCSAMRLDHNPDQNPLVGQMLDQGGACV